MKIWGHNDEDTLEILERELPGRGWMQGPSPRGQTSKRWYGSGVEGVELMRFGQMWLISWPAGDRRSLDHLKGDDLITLLREFKAVTYVKDPDWGLEEF